MAISGELFEIPVEVPGALLADLSGCVAHRPLPLALVAVPAPGSAPIAPHASLRYYSE
ncbi:MAG: hypothetical protein IKA47_00875 [Oscillospiraceae bacterium]|nr:hypothetical protein [Oscillospiraceae bacterium]